MCDSNGYIYDPEGIKLDIVKDIKEVKRGRIKEYADRVEGATYTEGKGIWNIKCDIYLPCATQNELDLDAVKILIANGCKYVAEGANMPTCLLYTSHTAGCHPDSSEITLLLPPPALLLFWIHNIFQEKDH